MVSRDYTKELGLNLAQKSVPMPYVLGLLTLIVALGGYGFHATWPVSHAKPAEKKNGGDDARSGAGGSVRAVSAERERDARLVEPGDDAQAGNLLKMRVEGQHGRARLEGVGGDQNILCG